MSAIGKTSKQHERALLERRQTAVTMIKCGVFLTVVCVVFLVYPTFTQYKHDACLKGISCGFTGFGLVVTFSGIGLLTSVKRNQKNLQIN